MGGTGPLIPGDVWSARRSSPSDQAPGDTLKRSTVKQKRNNAIFVINGLKILGVKENISDWLIKKGCESYDFS